jgi:nucleoside-diphosphate-sugar epimerase
MHFTPAQLAAEITRQVPGFEIDYKVDPVRQEIADSWPHSMDDSAARKEWGFHPVYGLADMTRDMLAQLGPKLLAHRAGTTSVA